MDDSSNFLFLHPLKHSGKQPQAEATNSTTGVLSPAVRTTLQTSTLPTPAQTISAGANQPPTKQTPTGSTNPGPIESGTGATAASIRPATSEPITSVTSSSIVSATSAPSGVAISSTIRPAASTPIVSATSAPIGVAISSPNRPAASAPISSETTKPIVSATSAPIGIATSSLVRPATSGLTGLASSVTISLATTAPIGLATSAPIKPAASSQTTGAAPSSSLQAQGAQTNRAPPSLLTRPNKSAAIVGLTAGAVLAIAILVSVWILCRKRRRHFDAENSLSSTARNIGDAPEYAGAAQTSEKTISERTTDAQGQPGAGWDQQHLQILAMAEKRKDAILAEKSSMEVNNFLRAEKFKGASSTMPKPLKSSMKKNDDIFEAFPFPPSNPPAEEQPSPPNLSEHPAHRNQGGLGSISPGPLLETNNPFSGANEYWDDQSLYSLASYVDQETPAAEEGYINMVMTQTASRNSASSEGTTFSFRAMDTIYDHNETSTNDQESVNSDSQAKFEIPPRNPERLARMISLRIPESKPFPRSSSFQ